VRRVRFVAAYGIVTDVMLLTTCLPLLALDTVESGKSLL